MNIKKISTSPKPNGDILEICVKCQKNDNLPKGREDPKDQKGDNASKRSGHHNHPTRYDSPRSDVLDPGYYVCSTTYEATKKTSPGLLGWESNIYWIQLYRSCNLVKDSLHWWLNPLCYIEGRRWTQTNPVHITTDASTLGWGAHEGTLDKRPMEYPLETSFIEYKRIKRGRAIAKGFSNIDPGQGCPNPVNHCHHSGLSKQTNKISLPNGPDGYNTVLGSSEHQVLLGFSPERVKQYPGKFPE